MSSDGVDGRDDLSVIDTGKYKLVAEQQPFLQDRRRRLSVLGALTTARCMVQRVMGRLISGRQPSISWCRTKAPWLCTCHLLQRALKRRNPTQSSGTQPECHSGAFPTGLPSGSSREASSIEPGLPSPVISLSLSLPFSELCRPSTHAHQLSPSCGREDSDVDVDV